MCFCFRMVAEHVAKPAEHFDNSARKELQEGVSCLAAQNESVPLRNIRNIQQLLGKKAASCSKLN